MTPIQPIYRDEHGTKRFKPNAIVRYLLDEGGIDMNRLAVQDFTDDDRQQFAQLIGYSLGGYSELGYTSNAVFEAANRIAEHGETPEQATIAHLTGELDRLRNGLRPVVSDLFGIHVDDLK